MKKAIRIGALGAVTLLMFVNLAAAQTQQAPAAPPAPDRGNQAGGAPGGAAGFGRGNFDPAQIQQMMDENNRQTLGATPEEWKVFGPRFTKVRNLSQSLNGGLTGLMGMFGVGRGGLGRGGMAMAGGMGDMVTRLMGEPTELDKARDKLNAALQNPSATTELQAAMKAFRSTKEKLKQELSAAQGELRKICTPQQEATLMAMGLLD